MKDSSTELPFHSFEFTFELPLAQSEAWQTGMSQSWGKQKLLGVEHEESDRDEDARATIEITGPNTRASATGKRKLSDHDVHDQAGTSNKKRKTIGRPRNDWTPSRCRKLVRLYLMSDLTVEEIIKVLRSRGFTPSKRDVQDQLKILLQKRPNTIRGRTVLPKYRLRLVRECRVTYVTNEMPSTDLEEAQAFVYPASQARLPQMDDRGQSTSEPLLECYPNSHVGAFWPANQEKNDMARVAMNSVHFGEVNLGSFTYSLPAETRNSELQDKLQDKECHAATPLLMTDTSNMESDQEVRYSGITQSPNLLDYALSQNEPNATRKIVFKTSIRDISQKSPGTTNTSISRPDSWHSSIHSVGGVQKRLPSKTESCLEDVRFLIQDLSISGSSMYRSSTSSRCSTISAGTGTRFKAGLRPLGDIDENEQYTSSGPYEHHFLLPGYFAGGDITSPRFDHNDPDLRRIAVAKYRSDRLALLDYRIDHDSFIEYFDKCLYGQPYRDIHDLDAFGNSVLHITTALRKPPAYLFSLLDMMTDIQTTNTADETFLHLLDQSIIKDTDPFHTLLGILQNKSSDFSRRDCLGRTPLHLLLQSWMERSCLDSTLAQLSFLGIAVPASRDHLGRTIISQLKCAGIPEARMQYLYPTKYAMRALPNYGIQTSIETVADLLRYEQQASLLRTIRKAWSDPQYEDHAGRNGLHCLAEASFKLPLPDSLPVDNKQTDDSRRREELQALLKVGVDVNNYDKQGKTPLMSFILHDRDAENDEAFHTLLYLLCKAGANVHRRDRQGRSPLHLAVMLGKKTATHLLLTQGANVHVRDIDGLGIIALGLKHSKMAKRSSTLYAQIMLCVSLVADFGGIATPTFLNEWTRTDYIHSCKMYGQEVKESRWALLPRRSLRKRDA